MTALPPNVGIAFLNIVGQIIVRENGICRAGVPTTELADGPPMPVIEVLDKSDLTAVAELYGDVPALQIVWSDSRQAPLGQGLRQPAGFATVARPGASI